MSPPHNSTFFNQEPPRLIEVASGLGSREIVQILIAKDERSLFYAARTGHRDIMELLLDAATPPQGSADPRLARLLAAALEVGDEELVSLERNELERELTPAQKKPGNDLLSHPRRAVPSARQGLTSVFGMGTGGSPAP